MYYYRTSVGTFLIAQRSEWWHVLFDNESLVNYATAQQAVDDRAGGHTFSPGRSIDTSKLGLPRDINEWNRGTP